MNMYEDEQKSGIDLFDRAREDGSATSKVASAKLEDLRESQREVLALLIEHGPLIDEELNDVARREGIKQSPSGIRTRRSELVDLGLVEATGETRETWAGNPAKVWRATVEVSDE